MLHRHRMFRLAVLILPVFASQGIAAEKVDVLLMGGRGHDWEGFYNLISEVVERTGDFQLTLSADLDDLKAPHTDKYDVVLFYGSGGNFVNNAQEKGLAHFVAGGGGMVGVHATDAFKKSDLYWRLLGGRFTGHGGGKFTIRIDDKNHPITARMKGFEIQDETYRNEYHPNVTLHSLGHVDRGQEQQSMIWVHKYKKGRIFNTTLGHDQAAWTNPAFQQLVVRGLYWAAEREPKDPPAN